MNNREIGLALIFFGILLAKLLVQVLLLGIELSFWLWDKFSAVLLYLPERIQEAFEGNPVDIVRDYDDLSTPYRLSIPLLMRLCQANIDSAPKITLEDTLEGKYDGSIDPRYRCPITLNLMDRPLTLDNYQHSYDLSSLMRICLDNLQKGRDEITCPLTSKKYKIVSLLSLEVNSKLQLEIREFVNDRIATHYANEMAQAASAAVLATPATESTTSIRTAGTANVSAAGLYAPAVTPPSPPRSPSPSSAYRQFSHSF